MGLLFHKDTWLDGYGTWRRRLVRLAHISFFGIAFINLSFAFSVAHLKLTHPSGLTSSLLMIAAVCMPLVCYLAAWRKPLRHLFPIPALSLLIGISYFVFTEVIK